MAAGAGPSLGSPRTANFSLCLGSKGQPPGAGGGGAPGPLELSLGLRTCSEHGKELLWSVLLLLFKLIQFNKHALTGDTKNLLDFVTPCLEIYPKEIIRDVCKGVCAMMLIKLFCLRAIPRFGNSLNDNKKFV